jgi:threonine dehydrogenase-like Zn-dependent dehydrogenase
MKTAILKTDGGFTFLDTPVPEPGADEALIHVAVCGVCTSDIGAYKNGGLEEGYILGHEVVGWIEKLGGGASGFAVGDRVTGMILEGYREYTVAKTSMLVPLPDSLSNVDAILEPLVCLLSGLDRLPLDNADHVAVLGTGYMGLSLIRLLADRGVPYIAALDVKEDLFPLALEMGAAVAARPDESMYDSYDMVFEVTGAAAGLELCGKLCCPYGDLVLVGYHPDRMDMSIAEWQAKGLAVLNSFENRPDRVVHYLAEAIGLVEAGFPAARLITHSFSFEELTKAFETHAGKPEGYLKSYIRME